MKNLIILLFFSFSFLNNNADLYGQDQEENVTTTYFLHIKPRGYKSHELLGFELFNRARRNQTQWTSPFLEPLQKDSEGYLVKVDIPNDLIPDIKMLKCKATAIGQRRSGIDTVQFSYGGVNLSSIRLNIASNPAGAEVYLIPNRIWKSRLENENWKDDMSLLADFRVSTSLTETYAFVDETVFKVIFRLGDQFQILTHFTKPPTIEKEQYISVRF